MKCSIDIGSNSILLLIGSYKNQELNIVEDISNVTGLGKGIDKNKKFTTRAMSDSYQVLKNYKSVIEEQGLLCEDAIVTATEASRVVTNSKGFFEKIYQDLGLRVQVISGAGEAFYTAEGVKSASKDKVITILDVGGASAEVIKLGEAGISDSISLPIGCVRFTDSEETGNSEIMLSSALNLLKKETYKTKKLVCVAGTITSLAAMYKALPEYDAVAINGINLSLEEFSDFKNETFKQTLEELINKFPYLKKRLPVLNGGARLIQSIAKHLDVECLEVSTFGLRHGTLISGKIEKKYLL